jgi:hypothetical protein
MKRSIALIVTSLLLPAAAFSAPAATPPSKLKSADFLECSVTYSTYLFVLQEGGDTNAQRLEAIKELTLMSGSIAQALSKTSIEERFKAKLAQSLSQAKSDIRQHGVSHYLTSSTPAMRRCDSLIKSNTGEILELLSRQP